MFPVTLLDMDSECLLLKNLQTILQRISGKSQFKTAQHTSGHVKVSTLKFLGIVRHSCCNIWRS